MMRGLQASSSFIVNRGKKPKKPKEEEDRKYAIIIGSRKQARRSYK
jgi:hypothetical protein